MPRRSILSVDKRENLLALPGAQDQLTRHYTFGEADLSIIRHHRGNANRLGFAFQLCYLRFPGIILGVDQSPFPRPQFPLSIRSCMVCPSFFISCRLAPSGL